MAEMKISLMFPFVPVPPVFHKEFVGPRPDKLLVGGCLALALLAAGRVAAQDVAASYPSRAVRVIVPAAPGGGADITARLFGQQLGKSLGQTFVVDNRPGASNIIGTEPSGSSPAEFATISPSGARSCRRPASSRSETCLKSQVASSKLKAPRFNFQPLNLES